MPAPLEPTTVEVRLSKLDGKTSDKLSVPGTLTTAQNVEMTVTGRYDRRPGTLFLDTIVEATRLHGGEREVLVGTDDTLYSDLDGNFEARGSIAGYRSRHTPINNSSFAQVGHDMIQAGGFDWHVWTQDDDIRYCVRDSTTGAYLVVDGVVATSGAVPYSRPRLTLAGTDVLVTYAEDPVAGQATLRGRKIALATPDTVSAASTIETVWPTNIWGPYDVVLRPGTTKVCVALWNDELGGALALLKLREWDVSTMTSSATLLSASHGSTAALRSWLVNFVDTGGSTYTLVTANQDFSGAGLPARIERVTTAVGLGGAVTFNIIFSSAVIGDIVRNVTGALDSSSTLHVLTELSSSVGSTRNQLWYSTRTSGGVVTGPVIRYGFRLMSRIFAFNGSLLAMTVAGVTTISAGEDRSYYLLDVTNGTIVGRALASLGAASTATVGLLPSYVVEAADVLLPSQFYLTTTQQAACMVRFDLPLPARWLEIAGVTLVPGSTIYLYDGAGLSELGFYHPPSFTGANQASGLGPGAGIYYYRMTWAWTDAQGRLCQSEPSEAIGVTTIGTGNARLTALTLNATLKSSPVQGAVLFTWRTEKNPSAAAAAAFYFVVTVLNDPTVDTQVIDDLTTDVALVTHARLYTLGNTVLGNATPPPANCLAAWNNRVWSAERDFLWYSKELEDGLGVAFPAENFVQVSDDRGDIVAIADAGQRLLVAKASALYTIAGDGPDATGKGAFSPVRRLPYALGARSSVSTIATELGVFFQDDSSGVIWLLPPDGAPVAIGREVEALSAALEITDAVVVPARRQVRFLSADGITLIYDMAHQLWTSNTDQPAATGAVVDDVFGYVTPTGELRFDNAATWVEGGGGTGEQPYTAALETGWVSPNQVAGYARVFAVVAAGVDLGEHQLSMQLSYRYDDGTEDAADVTASATDEAFGYRVEGRPHLRNQQAGAVRVRLEDDAPLTAGFGFEALSLTVGLRPGRQRVAKVNVGQTP
jgi:hypothetical protein